MVQIIPRTQKTFGEKIGAGISQGVESFFEEIPKAKERKALAEKYPDIAELPKEFQKMALEAKFKGQMDAEKLRGEREENKKIVRALEREHGREEGEYEDFISKPNMIPKPRAEKNPLGGLGGTPLKPEEAAAIRKVVRENPNANAEELELAFIDENIAPERYSKLLESRRRQEETQSKGRQNLESEIRKEVAPIKKEIADRAQSARIGIENKERLLNLIDQGNLDDPTWASLAYNMPLDLGKRLLSPDTVEYKAGLIEEFGDLRKLFQGQTRVKELEILEDKLADVYLTDEQKKRILKSRINALQGDIIREDAAEKIESSQPGLGVLQFRKAVEKEAKPQLDKLFDRIIDEQKFVMDQAEKKKDLPLNPNDSEDLLIMQQILREAGGNKKAAWKLAEKKGYSFK